MGCKSGQAKATKLARAPHKEVSQWLREAMIVIRGIIVNIGIKGILGIIGNTRNDSS